MKAGPPPPTSNVPTPPSPLNVIGLLLLKKKHKIVSIERDRPFPLKFWTKNRSFLRPQLSLKIKTITNQEQIGSLVYPEITQIIERSL